MPIPAGGGGISSPTCGIVIEPKRREQEKSFSIWRIMQAVF